MEGKMGQCTVKVCACGKDGINCAISNDDVILVNGAMRARSELK